MKHFYFYGDETKTQYYKMTFTINKYVILMIYPNDETISFFHCNVFFMNVTHVHITCMSVCSWLRRQVSGTSLSVEYDLNNEQWWITFGIYCVINWRVYYIIFAVYYIQMYTYCVIYLTKDGRCMTLCTTTQPRWLPWEKHNSRGRYFHSYYSLVLLWWQNLAWICSIWYTLKFINARLGKKSIPFFVSVIVLISFMWRCSCNIWTVNHAARL